MKTTELLAITIGALILLAAISPALATTPQPDLKPRIRYDATNGYSTNWSGYAVTGAAGSVSSVSGSWIVPQATSASKHQQLIHLSG